MILMHRCITNPAKTCASDNPNIRKLGQKADKRPEDMTYEEWERYQDQQQYEQDHAEEISIEEEVPDWFRDNVELGDADHSLDSILIPDFEDDTPADPAPPTDDAPVTDSNYVPEWFLGLDAQELDDAPEWVKEATSKTDISGLTDTTAFELPPVEDILDTDEPEAAEAPLDFFSSLSADDAMGADDDLLAGLDLPTMLPVDESPPDSDIAAAMDDLFDDAVPEDDGSLDWLEDSPADDEFETMLQEAADDSEGLDWLEEDLAEPATTASSADDDSPDWMQGVAAAATTPAAAMDDDSDDLFANMGAGTQTADADDDWLGDLGDADFEGAEGDDDFFKDIAPPQPSATDRRPR